MKHIVTIEVLKSKNQVASVSRGLAGGQAFILRGQVGGLAVQNLETMRLERYIPNSYGREHR